MIVGWSVIRKIIRISRIHHITSLADFLASRYGKSSVLGGFVSIIAVTGVVPYISLQLKAIPTSYLLITSNSETPVNYIFSSIPVLSDTAFYITIILIVFSILFGTRSLIATERHEGLVASIAFSSIVKLFAFITAGIFVTYFMYNGFGDIVSRLKIQGIYNHLFTMNNRSMPYSDWSLYIVISMSAVLLLPRQFQMVVVENVDESHISRAMWVFPLYLLIINIFVLPIAMGGLLRFGSTGVDADTFVLSLSMIENNKLLTLFIFIGGLSAASGMVIVETIALSTMISNDLIMPVLLRFPWINFSKRKNLSKLILYIRRLIITGILFISYSYFRYIGEFSALISSGLKSFVAVAQFAPLMIGGIFWKSGTKQGALSGLTAGFAIWIYTLIIPSFVNTGLIQTSFIEHGPFGIEFLKPFSLFGLTGLNAIAHSALWSLLANIFTYIVVSLISSPTTMEQTQASLFVDVFRYSEENEGSVFWRGTANVPDLTSLLIRFLGKDRTENALKQYSLNSFSMQKNFCRVLSVLRLPVLWLHLL
jgi:Na+/proline symporter